ncbi:ammonium transporter Rh type B isoform X3 [Paroedura picta]|uniref:ammonium transporter Rh type B isoform X3 n=1 Tax=Paroedura picta TaxID=143630 RepID=UPI004057607C
MSGHTTNLRLKLPLLCLVLQLLTILLFAIFVCYDDQTSARLWHEKLKHHNKSHLDHEFYLRYPSFQDVHTMIFVGFGFLMTFLRRYSFSSVAFNFLIAAFAIQWAVLIQGFFHSFHQGKIFIGIESLINADFCAGAVLISFGAVLGKTSPIQLLLMTWLEVVLFAVNEYVLLNILGAKDAGGSMTIHTFGAYFGLMASRVLYRPHLDKSQEREGSSYHSDLFAMIGTIFLWLFWPSFNSAITAHGDDQQRTVMNTYFSLTSSTLATFATSALVNTGGKLDMVKSMQLSFLGSHPECSSGRRGGHWDVWRDDVDSLWGLDCRAPRWLRVNAWLQIPYAHSGLQTENPGHLRSPQPPWDARDPRCPPGGSGGSSGHS